MLPAPSSPFEATVGALVVACLSLAFGYLLIDTLLGSRLDTITRLGLAPVGLAGFVLAVMLAHMTTGGWLLASPLAVRLSTLITGLILLFRKLRRDKRGDGGRVDQATLIALTCLLLLGLWLWCTPLPKSVPLGLAGDTKRHLAWASQLLNGETTPSAFITGDVPNYYPWLFHAFTAWLAHFTPGGRALHALAPMQMILVGGGVLTLFALGRQLTGSWLGGSAASLFGCLSGGFGFLLARGPALEDPRVEGGRRALKYMGDLLLRRSYNLSFHNLSPPFPRDLSFVLFFALVLLLIVGLTRSNSRILVAAGVDLGLIGLAGGEAFIVAFAIVAIVAIMPWEMRRLRVAGLLIAPALAIYGLWLVPLMISYMRLHGFMNTAGPLVDLPIHAILISWGIVTPFALYGAICARSSIPTTVHRRLVVVIIAVAFAMPVLSRFIAQPFGEGFTTLARSHRYWPIAFGAMVPLGAIGAANAFARLAATRKRWAFTLAVVAFTLAVPSPILGSLKVSDRRRPDAILVGAAKGDKKNVLNVVSHHQGEPCVAAVPPNLTSSVSLYTGYRLVSFNGRGRGRARIRWRRIPESIPGPRRSADNDELTLGYADTDRTHKLLEKYGVDIVVVYLDAVESFREWPIEMAGGYAVVRVTRCGL